MRTSSISFIGFIGVKGYSSYSFEAFFKKDKFNTIQTNDFAYKETIKRATLKMSFNYERPIFTLDSPYSNNRPFVYEFVYQKPKKNSFIFDGRYLENTYNSYSQKIKYSGVKQGSITFKASYFKNSFSRLIRNIYWDNQHIYSHRMIGVYQYLKNKVLPIIEFSKNSVSLKSEYIIQQKSLYLLNDYSLEIPFSFISNKINLGIFLSKDNYKLSLNKSVNLNEIGTFLNMSINNYIFLFDVYSPFQSYGYATPMDLNSVFLEAHFELKNVPLRDFNSSEIILRINIHKTSWREPDGDIIDIPIDITYYKFNSYCFVSKFPNVYKEAYSSYKAMFKLLEVKDYHYVTNKLQENVFHIVNKDYYKLIKGTIRSGTLSYMNTRIKKYRGCSNEYKDIFKPISNKKTILTDSIYKYKINEKHRCAIPISSSTEKEVTIISLSKNNSYKDICLIFKNKIILKRSETFFFLFKANKIIPILKANAPKTYHRHFIAQKDTYNSYYGIVWPIIDTNPFISNEYKLHYNINCDNVLGGDCFMEINPYLKLEGIINNFISISTSVICKDFYSETFYFPIKSRVELNGLLLQVDLSINSANLNAYYSPTWEINK